MRSEHLPNSDLVAELSLRCIRNDGRIEIRDYLPLQPPPRPNEVIVFFHQRMALDAHEKQKLEAELNSGLEGSKATRFVVEIMYDDSSATLKEAERTIASMAQRISAELGATLLAP